MNNKKEIRWDEKSFEDKLDTEGSFSIIENALSEPQTLSIYSFSGHRSLISLLEKH